MTIAEEVTAIWDGVQPKPKKGAESAYYADLLRRVMVSKKQLEETGRKYSILPDLRELTRRTLVRIPAEHVPYLEISVFDLVSNPLKKNLQPFVSEFSPQGSDLELVSWFVRHAKKEPTLALEYKTLQAWLDEKTQPSDHSDTKRESNTVAATHVSESLPGSPSEQSQDTQNPVTQTDTTVAIPPIPESDGTNADRIFEHE